MHRTAARPGARTGATGTAPGSGATDVPDDTLREQPLVDCAFAFVDLCGFTRFTTEEGEQAALGTIRRFRSLARHVTGRRGVLINKWLGDGALLVGAEVSPVIAATMELLARQRTEPLDARAGLGHGQVLVIDGDDYVGRPANLASRLCDAARPGELLTVELRAEVLPRWIQVRGVRSVSLRGVGRLPRVQVLGLAPGIEFAGAGEATDPVQP
jgi:class 3 adenylate cyclase